MAQTTISQSRILFGPSFAHHKGDRAQKVRSYWGKWGANALSEGGRRLTLLFHGLVESQWSHRMHPPCNNRRPQLRLPLALAAWPSVVVPPLRRVRDALVRLQLLRRHVAIHVCAVPVVSDNQTAEADAGTHTPRSLPAERPAARHQPRTQAWLRG